MPNPTTWKSALSMAGDQLGAALCARTVDTKSTADLKSKEPHRAVSGRATGLETALVEISVIVIEPWKNVGFESANTFHVPRENSYVLAVRRRSILYTHVAVKSTRMQANTHVRRGMKRDDRC